MTSLTTQHALVTGGGRGIGRAVAAALTGAGARVSILGRDAATLERAVANGIAQAFAVADVTDEVATRAAIEKLASLQHFSIAVANAGGAEIASFHRSDAALFRRMFELNVMSVRTVFDAVLPSMSVHCHGRLVAIASTAGHRGYDGASAYCAAKHAVLGLVKSLALEHARLGTGVTINAISPGYADTDLVARGVRGIARKGGISEEEAKSYLTTDNPMGRLVQPEEVAAAALYLCGPGSGSINGQSLLINGGEF